MTPEDVARVGRAAGRLLRERSGASARPRAVIGKDTRLSGYMIEQALTSGFLSSGVDVLQFGPLPTPAVSMLTRSLRADLGAMVSASHNPYYDNGLKFFDPEGFKLSDADERRLESLIADDSALGSAESRHVGRARRIEDAQARYIEFAKRTLPSDVRFDGLRVAVDCAHGAGYRVIPSALWELGAEVIAIGVSPDGLNVNRDSGSMHPEALIAATRDADAHVGIAFDGDADRSLFVDERGGLVDGDQTLAVLLRRWMSQGRLRGDGAVGTSLTNAALETWLSERDLRLMRVAVGDRNVLRAMRSEGFNLGGEPSGHVLLLDVAATGDALVVALQMLAALRESGESASSCWRPFEPLPQASRDVTSSLSEADLERGEASRAIELARAALGDDGRLVVRRSGTQPLLRVMGESADADAADRAVETLARALESARGSEAR